MRVLFNVDATVFLDILASDYFAGVPDSLLRPLVDCLMERYGMDPMHHVIGANEGNCAAIAAGYNMATGRIPVVYMQNSGEGNIINPLASLLNEKVYAIPMIFVIGWRGEPGVHDELQHIYQGEVTIKLLEDMGIASFVIGADTGDEEVKQAMVQFRGLLDAGKNAAFVIQMEGVDQVLPNIETHPEFGTALEEAKKAGVKVLFLGCRVEEDSLTINREFWGE